MFNHVKTIQKISNDIPIQIVNGKWANEYLKEYGYQLSNVSCWYGYVDGSGLVCTDRGRLLAYGTKQVANVMFNGSGERWVKIYE